MGECKEKMQKDYGKRAKRRLVPLNWGILISFLLISTMSLSGCVGRDNPDDGAGNNKFIIVTSFYPMYVAAINIARDISGVEVLNMTKAQTGCLHDYQLTPEDLKILELADAFIINGAGMESFMADVISQQKNLKIIEASQGIQLLKDASGLDNPHVWVSISNAITQVKTITKQLSAIDPEHAAGYEKNSDAYILKLESLKAKMHSGLDGIKNRDIITFHEAFPYFAQEFGLQIVAVIEREPGTAPSPKELNDTIDIIQKSGIKALFVEPQYPAKAAETIAVETGAKLYDLDPAVTGEARPDGYDDYIQVMEQNLISLMEALK